MRAFFVVGLFLGAARLEAGTLRWEALAGKAASAPASQALQAEAAAAQARRRVPLRAFAPQLRAYGQGHSEAWRPGSSQAWTEAGLEAQANLWRGGRDSARSRALAQEASAAGARSGAARRGLLLNARLTWLEAWSARRRLEALSQAQARCQEDLQRVRRQARAGLVSPSDVLALEVLSAELDQHAFDDGHLADEAEHHLAALLGLGADQAEDLTDGEGLGWPLAQAGAGVRRLEQVALEAELRALEEGRQALGASLQPSLDLGAQWRAGRAGYGLGEASDLQALASLSLAWDSAGAADSEQAWLAGLAKAKRDSLEAQARADAVEREELGHALASWVGRRTVAEERLASTGRFRAAVLEENARGVRDSRDLLDSNQALLEADLDLVTARLRAWSVWSELQTFELGAEP